MLKIGDGNRISKKANIQSSQNIVIQSKSILYDCTLRGDLKMEQSVSISMGSYCILKDGCKIIPPFRTYKSRFSYYPMRFGNGIIVGENAIVSSSVVGSGVKIGSNCVIGQFVMIKDGVIIEDGVVVPDGTVIPSFTIVTKDKMVQGPESMIDALMEEARLYYYQKIKEI
ncbi:dynactin subunit p25 [Gorgonomyces haynaldii]|nr:dynactin subunit p25 [Gorgonomyces haynaldii]